MEKAKRFEDLWIWQEARSLVKNIYEELNQGPVSRDFGFCDQLHRAGISIMNNIAEGFERNSDLEFARYLDFAKGSCGEVRSMYYAAEDLGYLEHELAEVRRNKTKQIAAGISSLIALLKQKKDK
jgi:four helix bundle protein